MTLTERAVLRRLLDPPRRWRVRVRGVVNGVLVPW